MKSILSICVVVIAVAFLAGCSRSKVVRLKPVSLHRVVVDAVFENSRLRLTMADSDVVIADLDGIHFSVNESAGYRLDYVTVEPEFYYDIPNGIRAKRVLIHVDTKEQEREWKAALEAEIMAKLRPNGKTFLVPR
jgi:hypothetical protein